MLQEINEEWISDKTRFACDGLRVQRLLQPMRRDAGGQMRHCDWEEALFTGAQKLRQHEPQTILALAGGERTFWFYEIDWANFGDMETCSPVLSRVIVASDSPGDPGTGLCSPDRAMVYLPGLHNPARTM